MSFKLMANALDIVTGSTHTKMVLLKLCDNANDEGECWPSHANLAKHCEMNKRSVMRHIDILIDMGIVRKINRFKGNTKTSNCYFINLSNVTQSQGGSDTESLGGSDTESHKPITSFKQPLNQGGDLFEGQEQKKDPLKTKEKKTTYSECIKLTEAEYTKLIVKYDNSEAILKDYIEELNNYKMSKNKKYASDYHVMLTWVFKNFTEDKAKNNTNNNKNISDDDLFFD